MSLFYGEENTQFYNRNSWIIPRLWQHQYEYADDCLHIHVVNEGQNYTSTERLEAFGTTQITSNKRGADLRQIDGTYLIKNIRYIETLYPLTLAGYNVLANVLQPADDLSWPEYNLRDDWFTHPNTVFANLRKEADNTKLPQYSIQVLETYNFQGVDSATLYKDIQEVPAYNAELTAGLKVRAPRKRTAVLTGDRGCIVLLYKLESPDQMYDILSVCGNYILQHCTSAPLELKELGEKIFQAVYTRDDTIFANRIRDLWNIVGTNVEETLKTKRFEAALTELSTWKKKSVKTTIQKKENQIQNYESSLHDMYEELNDYRLQLIALESNQDDSTELRQFLTHNKDKVTNFQITPNYRIITEFITPCTSFSSRALKLYFDNRYRDYRKYDKVIDAIFFKQEYVLYLKAKVNLDAHGSNMTSRWNGDEGYSDELKYKGLPNIHIDEFDCFGSNKSIIQKLLTQGEYTSALMQLLASVGNLNFNDGTVTQRLFRYLERDDPKYVDVKCIQDPETEEWFTFRELNERLGQQDDTTE